MGEFPYVEWLARYYKKKGENSNNWTDYLKAHGLANYCLVKDPTQKRHKLVYEIEENWYKGSHPLSYEEHRKLTREHKRLLGNFRKNVSSEFQSREMREGTLDVSDVFSASNMKKLEKFAQQTFEASEDCTRQFTDMSRTIIESSVKLLRQSGKKPPCKFSVLGLGSAAKGEVTPYSDLEYAFIVEKQDKYFEGLAVDSYFRIGNLGESPLKCFDIEEVKVAKDSAPIPDSSGTVGYRIDGITEKAGNIPTGNGRPNSQTLTLTVDELMELYRTSAESPFDGIAGDKSDMLSSTIVLYTNEGERSQLHQQFLHKREVYEKEVLLNQSVAKKRFDSFFQDIRSYMFLPEFAKFQPPNNFQVEVKVDVFRYPTLLANHMKLWLGLEEKYSWEVYKKLSKLGKLSKEVSLHLKIILAISLYLRTSTYLRNKSQTGVISLQPIMPTFLKTENQPPTNLFFVLGCLLNPVKHSIKRAVEEINTRIVDNPESPLNLAETMTTISRNLKPATVDLLLQAEVMYFLGGYPTAIIVLNQAIQRPFDFFCIDRVKLIKVLGQRNRDPAFIRKYVELACYLLYNTGQHQQTIDYLDWLIPSQSGDNAVWLLLKAHCAKEVQDFKTAGELLQQVKRLLDCPDPSTPTVSSLPTVESVYGSNMTHVDTVQFVSDVGITFLILGEFDEAERFLKKAVSIAAALGTETPHAAISWSRLGLLYNDLSNYETAMDCFHEALRQFQVLKMEGICFAEVHGNVGNVHTNAGKHDIALEHYCKALHMLLAIYGPQSAEQSISQCYNSIGDAYNSLHRYDEALRNLRKSLEMEKARYGEGSNHPSIASRYNNIGMAYSGKKDYSNAQKFYEKSLEMKRAAYGSNVNHLEIANSLGNLGALHTCLGNLDVAFNYRKEALQMRLAIYGTNARQISIFADIHNLIDICQRKGDHLTAMEYIVKLTEMGFPFKDA